MGVNDRLQPLDQLACLIVEQPQHFGIQCRVAAGVSGKMGKVDGG
jgi:hypothetical protein